MLLKIIKKIIKDFLAGIRKRPYPVLVFLILFSFLFVFFVKYQVNHPRDSFAKEEIIFLVKKGDSARDISNNLKKEGIINFAFPFRVYVSAKRLSGKLQAGNYSLSKAMTVSEIAQKFFKGEVIKKQVAILEGQTLKDIASSLESQQIIKAEDFFNVAGNLAVIKELSEEFEFLKEKPEDLGLEGYIYPDTYNFLAGEDVKEIVRKALTNLDSKLTLKLRKDIMAQGKTIFEIITMASLLEKEVRTIEDKKIVSGILWKRLKIGMPLQVDATVCYAISSFTRSVSIEETKTDSLYNTYFYKGLPKGPISNPGIESILAAIYPKATSYLYYLSARNGTTIFSKTFEEHKVAKFKYLR